jgi:hypothetical protein
MTSEKKTFLLSQLQVAIDEAVSESRRVTEIVEEMKRCGFDLCLMLESTVTISPTGDQQLEEVPEPRLASDTDSEDIEERVASGDFELTAEDMEFLQELNIAA